MIIKTDYKTNYKMLRRFGSSLWESYREAKKAEQRYKDLEEFYGFDCRHEYSDIGEAKKFGIVIDK